MHTVPAHPRYPWPSVSTAVLVATLLAACGRSAAPDPTLPSPRGDTLELREDTALSARLRELTVYSPALERETRLRLLLPADYATSTRRYPVLYLFHGCCDNGQGYSRWTTQTDIEAFSAELPVIVVMPDAGNGGQYADWYNNGQFGPPRWESYHVHELIPWIDAHYRTLATRAGRMLAGLSMGGLGAFSYAAQYPHLFASAAAYSPVLDTNTEASQASADNGAALDGGAPGSIWGPRALEEIRWRGHNPWDLAENLANTLLFIRTGDGRSPGAPVPISAIEIAVHQQAHNMHRELNRLGIPHYFEDYGEGTHAWPHWEEGLHLTLPLQLAHVAEAIDQPQTFAYRSIDERYTVHDWHVTWTRGALEFSRLAVTPAGFTLEGSGQAVVETATVYRPGATYTAQVDGVPRTLVADDDGRLRLELDLGPGRTFQEYRAGSENGYLATVTVSIESGEP